MTWYLRLMCHSIFFALVFLREFMVANLQVAYTILFVNTDSIKPHIVPYSTLGMSRREVLALSYMITLTPGTVVAEIHEDKEELTVHILNATEPAETLGNIDRVLKSILLGVTRC